MYHGREKFTALLKTVSVNDFVQLHALRRARFLSRSAERDDGDEPHARRRFDNPRSSILIEGPHPACRVAECVSGQMNESCLTELHEKMNLLYH